MLTSSIPVTEVIGPLDIGNVEENSQKNGLVRKMFRSLGRLFRLLPSGHEIEDQPVKESYILRWEGDPHHPLVKINEIEIIGLQGGLVIGRNMREIGTYERVNRKNGQSTGEIHEVVLKFR